MLSLETNNPGNVDLQEALCAWIEELPMLLIQLGDKHPASSLVIIICNLNSSSLCKMPEST
jgi:pre-rRNA-processing protein IPI1